VLAGAALALPALAQEAPEAEEEQPLPPIFAPERAPSAEQERPPTGQPDPAGLLQQDRTPREPTAPLPQDRALMLQAGGSLAWDSNIFRQSEAQSERIRTGYVGLRLDKSYRQQRWFLDATETAYRYANFSFLDFNALNYRGGWAWHLGPRVSGVLSAERAQALVNYGLFRDTSVRNVRTAERYLANGEAEVATRWHLLGGLAAEDVKYSFAFPQQPSYRARGAEAGLKYLTRVERYVSFKVVGLNADYTDRALDPVTLLDDGFRRREAQLAASWRLTAKTSLDARLSHLAYRYPHFSERDFSGNTGILALRWGATAKLTLDLGLVRDMAPWVDNFTSYRVEERASLGAAWDITARTTLRASGGHFRADYRNPVVPLAGPARSDTGEVAELRAEWRALRNVLFNAGWQHYRQDSNDPTSRFAGRIVTLGGSVLF
jgi:exopolysaccharide biosynthesis operon protein EpsL